MPIWAQSEAWIKNEILWPSYTEVAPIRGEPERKQRPKTKDQSPISDRTQKHNQALRTGARQRQGEHRRQSGHDSRYRGREWRRQVHRDAYRLWILQGRCG